MHVCIFSVDPVHCSWDPEVQIAANFSLKLGPTALFTHLKIILLQCFQFSAINGIQIDPQYTILILKNYLIKKSFFFLHGFLNLCHNFLQTKFSYKISCSFRLQLYSIFFSLEVNFDKSTFGLYFLFISSILAKVLENKRLIASH